MIEQPENKIEPVPAPEFSLGDCLDRIFFQFDQQERFEKQGDSSYQLDFSFLLPLEISQLGQILESVPNNMRESIWYALPAEYYWDVLLMLQTETARHLVDGLVPAQLQILQQNAPVEAVLALADVLPEQMVNAILQNQEDEVAEDLLEALAYDDDIIGRRVNKNVIRVRSTMSTEVLKKKLVKYAEQQEHKVAVYVLAEDKSLLGYVPLETLFIESQNRFVHELAEPIISFDHFISLHEASRQINPTDNVVWYPVQIENRIVGAVSLSAIVWELQDDISDVILHDTSSAEEDLFAPVKTAAKTRALWLGINLATAFLASWVIGWFELALQQIVALAILMPVVASMGGIAGSQTLAIALRGLALNHLTDANIKFLFDKEIKIAMLNGAIWGAIVGCVVAYWFGSWPLGMVIMVAIMVNSLAAASSGTFIPFVLKKFNIDPAISGSVILTTVTDVIGFVVFLGLASLVLV